MERNKHFLREILKNTRGIFAFQGTSVSCSYFSPKYSFPIPFWEMLQSQRKIQSDPHPKVNVSVFHSINDPS